MPSGTVTVVDTKYVKNIVNELNADYENLEYDFDGAMALFYEFVCDESQLPVKVASSPTRLLPRTTHDKILTERRSGTSPELSPLSFDSFPLKRFTTVAKYPDSLFRDGKIVVALDIMVHALQTIWTYSSEVKLDFRLLTTASCSHVPSYFISRFRHTMQSSTAAAPPIVPPLSSKVSVGVSTFGASVMGESYLRVMVPNLTDAESSDTSERSDTEEPENLPILALTSFVARQRFSTSSRHPPPKRTFSLTLRSRHPFEDHLSGKKPAVPVSLSSPSSDSAEFQESSPCAYTSGSRLSKFTLSGAHVLSNMFSSSRDVPLSPTPYYTKKRQHALSRAQSYKKSRTSAGPSRIPAGKEAGAGDEDRESDDDHDGKQEEVGDEDEEEQVDEKFGHPETSPITKRVPGHFSPHKARG